MTTVGEAGLLAEEQHLEQVVQWRLDELHRSGRSRRPLWSWPSVSTCHLHLACELLRTGCPEQTALRILLLSPFPGAFLAPAGVATSHGGNGRFPVTSLPGESKTASES